MIGLQGADIGERAPDCDPLGDPNGRASRSLAALARKVERVCEGLTSEEPKEFRVGARKTCPAWSAALEMPSCSPGEFFIAWL